MIVNKKKTIVTVVTVALVLLAPFIAYGILQLSLGTPHPIVVVISDSMQPNVNKGDVLFVRGEETSNVQNGDVIVFDAIGLWYGAPQEPIVHRIVDKWISDEVWYFVTKGDANEYPDPVPIPEKGIFGVMSLRVPFIGWVKIVLFDYGILFPLIVFLSIAFVWSLLKDIVLGNDREETSERDNNNGERLN